MALVVRVSEALLELVLRRHVELSVELPILPHPLLAQVLQILTLVRATGVASQLTRERELLPTELAALSVRYSLRSPPC